MVYLVTSAADHLHFSARVTAFSGKGIFGFMFYEGLFPISNSLFPFMSLYEYMVTKEAIMS